MASSLQAVSDTSAISSAFIETIERFCDHLAFERRYSPHTVAAYRSDLVGFALRSCRVGAGEPGAVSRRWVRAYLASLTTIGYAPSTVARKAASIRAYYRYLRRIGLVDVDPAAELRTPRRDRRLPRVPRPEAVAALIDAADMSPQGLRDRALIELLYGSGLRVSEACSLDKSDVVRSAGWIVVWGKGGKQRKVPVSEPARSALADYLGRGRPHLAKRAVQDTEALFLNQAGKRLTGRDARRILARYGAASPHMLRHACATHMIEGGADIRTVQEMLGHASVVTTQTYTHLSGDTLRRAFDRTHPRA
jgi:site-specific recombinase XerD